jgi:tetratricopeptide (TPR) repeat protein
MLAGCAGTSLSPDRQVDGVQNQELTEVPFFPQRDYECGPAALAEVLTHSGVPSSPDELVAQVYLPARRGSLQPEIIAAARHAGRLIYAIESEEEIQAQLRAGLPVLVFQNLGLPRYPQWHYAVVVGWTPGRHVVLRSGTTRRLVQNEATFLRTWAWGGRWAQVVLPPDRLPAEPDTKRYLSAAWSLESAGQYAAARSAYETAAGRWPDQELPWLAWSNLLVTAQENDMALAILDRGLQYNPRSDALQLNRAKLLLDRGQREEALGMVRAMAGRSGPWQSQAGDLLLEIESGGTPNVSRPAIGSP